MHAAAGSVVQLERARRVVPAGVGSHDLTLPAWCASDELWLLPNRHPPLLSTIGGVSPPRIS